MKLMLLELVMIKMVNSENKGYHVKKNIRNKIILALIVIFVLSILVITNLGKIINYPEREYRATKQILKDKKSLFDSLVVSLSKDSLLNEILFYNLLSNNYKLEISYCGSYFFLNSNENIKNCIYRIKCNQLSDIDKLNSFIVEFNKIIELIKRINIYAIHNSEHCIEIMLEEDISIFYLENEGYFEPENSDRFLFKHLEGNYYYYFHPSNGFLY